MARKQKEATNIMEVQNAAKTMFSNIRFQSIDNPIRSVLVTSSVPDEGKSTTSWYLAQAAATAGNRVLIVEADMRRRSLANLLQLHPGEGLFAVLTGNASLDDAMVSTAVRNLYFLDAEPSIPNPADIMASNRMRRLSALLVEQFDYVVFDTPPVGTFVDAAVLSTIVDGVVLVVRPGTPKRTELQLAYAQLANADANVLGICTTFVESTSSEYYYSYYTKGGNGGKNKKSRRSRGKKLDLVIESNPPAPAPSPAPNRKANGSASARKQSSIRPEEPAGPSSAPAAHADSASVKRENIPRQSNGSGISIPRGNPRDMVRGSGGVSKIPADQTTRIPYQ